mmetsp:Transcript_66330/g.184794  ORF Transcript_66330/g.184794 Transcript_66330/m.184794 type:complete len:234 (-) Transcript_66330:2292-2993(-)
MEVPSLQVSTKEHSPQTPAAGAEVQCGDRSSRHELRERGVDVRRDRCALGRQHGWTARQRYDRDWQALAVPARQQKAPRGFHRFSGATVHAGMWHWRHSLRLQPCGVPTRGNRSSEMAPRPLAMQGQQDGIAAGPAALAEGPHGDAVIFKGSPKTSSVTSAGLGGTAHGHGANRERAPWQCGPKLELRNVAQGVEVGSGCQVSCSATQLVQHRGATDVNSLHLLWAPCRQACQ